MLVITRSYEEEIFIGEEIRIVVLGVRGKYVKLGIIAPEKMKILRKELIEKELGQYVPSYRVFLKNNEFDFNEYS